MDEQSYPSFLSQTLPAASFIRIVGRAVAARIWIDIDVYIHDVPYLHLSYSTSAHCPDKMIDRVERSDQGQRQRDTKWHQHDIE
jgi:hypothetical protein